MKTTNALVAAALAGVFAAGTTVSLASPTTDMSVVAGKEKDDCPGKDKDKEKDKCPAKEEKKEIMISAEEKEKEKDDCPGKDKKKDKEEKESEIL